jgi:hypothetical protein
MNKLLSALIVGVLATASMASFAASHGGAMKDAKTMDGKMDDKMADCKKMDKKTADDKMKADCKKLTEAHKTEKK